MLHLSPLPFFFFFNNELILSAGLDFTFAIKVNIALLIQVTDQFLISVWSITGPRSHFLFASVLLKYLQIIAACGKYQTLETLDYY